MLMGGTIKQANFAMEIDEQDWKEVIELAKTVSPKVGQRAVSKVIDRGTEWTLETMRRFVGVYAEHPTGMLQNSLKKQRKRKYEPSFWHSAIAVNTGKKRGDAAFYWNIVEQGHKVVTPKGVATGRSVQAMRYAISAFDMAKPIVLADFASKVRAELEHLWKKKANRR